MKPTAEDRARAIRLPQGDQYGSYDAPLPEDHVKIVAAAIQGAEEAVRKEVIRRCVSVLEGFAHGYKEKGSHPEVVKALHNAEFTVRHEIGGEPAAAIRSAVTA